MRRIRKTHTAELCDTAGATAAGGSRDGWAGRIQGWAGGEDTGWAGGEDTGMGGRGRIQSPGSGGVRALGLVRRTRALSPAGQYPRHLVWQGKSRPQVPVGKDLGL